MSQKTEIQIESYNHLLDEVASLVQNNRVQAIQSVQTISNQLYWNIGELIIKKREKFGWGNSIIDSLSKDLPHLIGEGISWSTRNLRFMRQLVLEYSHVNQAGPLLSNLKPSVSDLDLIIENTNVKQAASHLEILNVKQAASHLENIKKLVFITPWYHNVLILQKVKNPKARIF